MTLKEKCAALEDRVKRLQEIGLSLSTEDDINVIFELIMEEAKNITNADGRTLYMISEDGKTSGIVVYLKKDERLAELIKIKDKFYESECNEDS